MSSERDLNRIVRSWLEEGVTALPDRVLDQVLDQLPATPQRRAWWPARRFPELNNVARLAIAAAAVAVIAFVGIRFLLPPSNSVGGPTQTPTSTPTSAPTALATPSPSPVAAIPLPATGAALPGRYSIQVPDSSVTLELTVADAEWTANGWYLGGSDLSVSFWTVGNVYADACDPGSYPDPKIGPTVDDLVSALDAQANTDMQSLGDVNVGQHPGKRVVMSPAAIVDCPGNPQLWFWQDPSGNPGRGTELMPPGGRQDVIWLIDVDGDRVVIVGFYDPSDPAEATRVLDVIDSIEFVLP
jgi:hypothetical protein